MPKEGMDQLGLISKLTLRTSVSLAVPWLAPHPASMRMHCAMTSDVAGPLTRKMTLHHGLMEGDVTAHVWAGAERFKSTLAGHSSSANDKQPQGAGESSSSLVCDEYYQHF